MQSRCQPPLDQSLGAQGRGAARILAHRILTEARKKLGAWLPRPMGVVRSKCGLLSTLSMAPREWVRSMMCTSSIIDLVARSHSATTNTSPVPDASMAFSSCGRPLDRLADAFAQ